MTNPEQHIRDLFQEKLTNHETPVDPSVWTAVSSSMGGAGSAGIAGLSQLGQWILGIAGTVVVGSVAWVLLTGSPDQPEQSAQNTLPPIVQEQNEIKSQPEESVDLIELETQEKNSPSATRKIDPQPEKENTPSSVDTGEQTSVETKFRVSDTTQSYQIARGAPPQANPPNATKVEEQPQMPELSAKFEAVRSGRDRLDYSFFPQNAVNEWNYTWEIADVQTNSQNPVYEFQEEGEHFVRLTVEHDGKQDVHEVKLLVYYPPIIEEYNVFSPNGDGLNDVFDLNEGAVNAEVTKLLVYDQSGTMVFESLTKPATWDGKNRFGVKCQPGTYVYFYEAISNLGETLKGQGQVTLF